MTATNRLAQDIISLRSTMHTQAIARDMSVQPDLWLTASPMGRETLQYRVGQTVVSTGKGLVKPGIEMVVKAAFLQNGYARYLAGGVYHKASDLIAK